MPTRLEKNEHGATMVEAALVFGIFIFLIGIIVDVGFGLYQYNYLHYVTTRAAREISAKLSVASSCGDISERYVSNVAHKEMTNAMQTGAKAQWTWSMIVSGGNEKNGTAVYTYQIVGRLPLTCYFLCAFIPNAWTLTSTVSATLDNRALFCPPGGPAPG